MLKITKQKKGRFTLENEEILTKIIFNDSKIWLNIKELSKIFGEKKSTIQETINIILLDGEYDVIDNMKEIYNSTKENNEKYYNLDIIISLGYRVGAFDETKLLIKAYRTIKEYTQLKETKLSNFKKGVKNISKLIKGFQVH